MFFLLSIILISSPSISQLYLMFPSIKTLLWFKNHSAEYNFGGTLLVKSGLFKQTWLTNCKFLFCYIYLM